MLYDHTDVSLHTLRQGLEVMYTDKLSIFPYALTIELHSIGMDHIWLHCD